MRFWRSFSGHMGWVALFVFLTPLIVVAQATNTPARVTQRVDVRNTVTLRGNIHPLARPEFDRGVAPDDLLLRRILLVLQRGTDQETELRKLLDEQQIKSSPSFHKWLTPEEFGRRFGPSDADVQAVTDWLTAQGFQVNRVGAGRTVIEFSGTAGLVRQALHTEIHKYEVRGQAHWANASDPQIPVALAPVVRGVASLNNFPRRPLHHDLGTFTRSKATGEVRPQFTFSSGLTTSHAVGPTDFATIYNVLPLWNAGTDGTGQTIAIVSPSNLNLQDVRDFRAMFGLPPNDPNIILNGPDPGIVTGPPEAEADLDVQWAGAVAKNATIDLVVSEDTETSSGVDLSALYIVDNNLAAILSESYGTCEAGLGTGGNAFYSSLWEQAAAQGITVLVAAGDNGSAGCDGQPGQTAASGGLRISGVASTPFNVAVGGTDFNDTSTSSTYWNSTNTATTQSSAKSYIPESTWNDSCAASGSTTGCAFPSSSGVDLVAGAGGPSNCALSSTCGTAAGYPKPAWQTGAGVPSDSVRDTPDVSLFAADGMNGSFYIFCQMDANAALGGSDTSCDLSSPFTNFQGGGGTSFSTPAFAGIIALVNQKTGERQGNANYILYPLAAKNPAGCNSSTTSTTNSSCIFYDVTKGNNSVACVGGSPNCSKTTSGGNGIMVVNPTATPQVPAWTTNTGYDLATGLGTVNVANLVNNWSSVSFAGTTTTLSLSPTSLTHGQSVSVTIGVTSASGTPTGDVSLIAQTGGNGAGVTRFTLSSGGASGSTIMLPGGSYNVTAHYAGDGTFGASDSAPVAVTVTPEASATTIAMITFDTLGAHTSTTASYGSPYVLRSNVTNSSGQACTSGTTGLVVYPCPTGTVTVTDNGQPIPEQGSPPGYTAGSYKLNSAGYLEDIYVQFPAGAHAVVATYGGDSGYNGSTGSDTITITAATTTTSLSASTTTPAAGANVTLTAVVGTQSNGAAPAGTVQFSNSGTALGSAASCVGTAGSPAVPSASCTATLTTSFTSTAQVTAVYSGDTNYIGSTSGTVAITVAPDFSLSASPTSISNVSPGTSATSKITLTASSGFTGSVAFTCAVPGTMTAAACSMNPTSVTTSGSTTLTVTTAAPTAVPPPFTFPLGFVGPAIIAGLFLLLLIFTRRRRLALVMGLLTLVLVGAGLVACGGGGGGGGGITHNPGTPAGTYSVTVTGTSGSLTHSTSVSVTVQ